MRIGHIVDDQPVVPHHARSHGQIVPHPVLATGPRAPSYALTMGAGARDPDSHRRPAHGAVQRRPTTRYERGRPERAGRPPGACARHRPRRGGRPRSGGKSWWPGPMPGSTAAPSPETTAPPWPPRRASPCAQRLPLVLVMASSGSDVNDGVHALHGWGEAAAAVAACSGVVPVLAAVTGPALSGPALLLGIADVTVMTPDAFAFLSGPAAVENFTGIQVSLHDLGGTRHARHLQWAVRAGGGRHRPCPRAPRGGARLSP